MARPARYEAAGAVYHVMARGDGGREIFENDADRFDWLRRMEEVCRKYGWRVHAWVLMGNHFHFLLETPEPNLVVGMKWFMGVISQGWNWRRKRHGHVFQGRYKAVVVDGEERSGDYFRVVADYIHLNPVRSGSVGGTTGKTLEDWRWSSFPHYAGKMGPGWLVKKRVLRAFQLEEGRRGQRAYASYLEERAKDRKGTLTDASLEVLRRGWYLGEDDFRDRLLDSLAAVLRPIRRRGSIAGEAGRDHDEAEAERIVRAAAEVLDLPTERENLSGRGVFRDEKVLVAWLVRKWTSASNAWVAERLVMGHPTSVSRAVGRVRKEPKLAARGRKVEKSMLIFTD